MAMTVDFRAQLLRQLQFLKNSAELYDQGRRDEAIRIGTCIRVLCHDTRTSTSLLQHLNAKYVRLLSTCDTHSSGSGSILNMSGNLKLEPFEPRIVANAFLDQSARKEQVSVSDWWDRELIYGKDCIDVTRRSLVLWAANQDGGAHVDEKPDSGFLLVTRGLDLTWTIVEETAGVQKSTVIHIQDLHLAALRQFAYELLKSTELLALAAP